LASARFGVRLGWLGTLLVVASLLLVACDWVGGASDASSTAPLEVLPPEDFTGTADGFSVVLTWSAPSASAAIVAYEITRNGILLESVAANRTTFTDYNLKPGSYSYAIRSEGRQWTSEPVATDVAIKTPPLEAARLEGRYRVGTKVKSMSGYANSGTALSFAWGFKPECRENACDVVWRDIFDKRIHAKLKRKKATYTGDYEGPFLARCRGTRSVSSVHLVIKAVKARAVGGVWRIAKFAGTLRSSEAPQFGCVGGRAVQTIQGVLRPGG
jgi:hypothetical protein